MQCHEFEADLAFSHKLSIDGLFDSAYARWFPGLDWIEKVEDRAMQRKGIDKILHFTEGNAWTVDEKMRRENYPDILLETVSVFRNNRKEARGWIYTCQCDFIVYGMLPAKKAYLLPVPLLKKAWLSHEREWSQNYRSVTANNRGRGGGRYQTISTAVPTAVLLGAIRDEMAQWFVAEDAGSQTRIFDFLKPALYQPHEYTLSEVEA